LLVLGCAESEGDFALPTTIVCDKRCTTISPAHGLGIPKQEKGIRPALALPYELNVHATVNASNSTVLLTFTNTGEATAVFHVRSGNPAGVVRTYTVEPGKQLDGVWNVASPYDLSVYGPNGFLRSFKGSIGAGAAVLDVASQYDTQGRGSIVLAITNTSDVPAEVSVLDAYTGKSSTKTHGPHRRKTHEPQHTFKDKFALDRFGGWYDLIVTVAGDPSFRYQLAGHVETGKESISDPAIGGVVTLKS
jgi:phospholipase C